MLQASFFIEYILKEIFNVIIDVSEGQYRNNREQKMCESLNLIRGRWGL